MTRRFRLSRRSMLRGMGAAIALPTLECMLPSVARAQAADPVRRFIAFYVPCGIRMDKWTPDDTGSSYSLPSILSPLEAVKDKLLVLSGIDSKAGEADRPGDHARGTAAFLTCAKPDPDKVKLGISVDQVVANAYGDRTALRSLELGAEGGAVAGGCDSGYSCAYQRNISWASKTTPMPKEINPRLAFDRVFAGSDATLTAEQIARRRREDLSILDFVRDDTLRLQATLGRGDKAKLDEYLTGLRELETRIESNTNINPACIGLEPPEGVASDPEEHVRTMVDVMALAARCDRTRAMTFMMGNGGSSRTFPFLGINRAHHELSHHQSQSDKLKALKKVNKWEVSMFARLLIALENTPEMLPNGTMGTALDNTVAVFGSEIADGNEHQHKNMPLLVAGRAGGALHSGRHVKFSGNVPQADLYLTLLRAMGIERDRYGIDGTGVLQTLLS